MAQVYGSPIDPPPFDAAFVDGRYDMAKDDEIHERFLTELREWVKEHTDSRSDLVGEVVRFPIADGYAAYMVYRTKPLQLIHIPLGDAWDIPEAHARGLRLSDIREHVERGHRLRELFGRAER